MLRNMQSPNSLNTVPPSYDSDRAMAMSTGDSTETNNAKRSPKKMVRRRSRNFLKPTEQPVKKVSSANTAIAKLAKESEKRIDYVIVYEHKPLENITGKKERRNIQKKLKLREQFMKSLAYDGIDVQEDIINDNVYMQLHVPFERLCKQAEKVKLEMPLKGCEIYPEEADCCRCWHNFEKRFLVTDDEVDFVSAPYEMNKHCLYDNHDNPDKFFRPAIRCLLTHNILINSDLRKVDTGEEQEDPLAKKGLPYLLHKKVYKDAFILHDESQTDPIVKQKEEELRAAHGNDVNIDDPDSPNTEGELLTPDTRRELMQTWAKFCPQKYQPLWKIRNYFGEKIALYFAWVGVWIETLWIPTIFGFCVFLYGLYLSSRAKADDIVQDVNNTTGIVSRVTILVQESLGVLKESFDNDVTPFYALGICLWGTIFLEVWKRRNARLAYEWDVDSFEDNEPDRPQFVGTRVKPDPIILGEETWYYPIPQQCMKFFASFIFLIVMVLVVFIAAGSVILYRVFMTINYCESLSSINCLLITTIASSLLNAIAIMILGKVYDMIAVKLTDWENHRTQTKYDDALIIKLFAFQFANSYTSCFYIAFFRGLNLEQGLFGMGPEYQDSCGEGTCMAMLSFQVLILMLIKPLPKLLKDIIFPWIKKLWRTRKCCRKQNQISTDKIQLPEYLEREFHKPDVGDFTLGEYTEKCIVYGFLMLFAASFPLAPLIAIIMALIDIRVDARRLLWMYRRPVSVIAQDIGMWYGILQFLNFVGVVTNGFIIAFTSTWGSKYSLTEKLWIVIIFEHVVFSIKMLTAALIPDVPLDISLAIKREKYQVARIMATAPGGQGSAFFPGKGVHQGSPDSEEARASAFQENDEIGLLPHKNKKKKKKKPVIQGDTVIEESPSDSRKHRNVSAKLTYFDEESPHSDDRHDRKLPSLKRKPELPPLGLPTRLNYGEDGNTYLSGGEERLPRNKSPIIRYDDNDNMPPVPEIQYTGPKKHPTHYDSMDFEESNA